MCIHSEQNEVPLHFHPDHSCITFNSISMSLLICLVVLLHVTHICFRNSFVTWVVFFFSFSCQLNMCAGIRVSCFKTVHCWHCGYWCKCDTLIVAPVLVTGHLATRCPVHHIYSGYRHSHLGSAGHWERLSNTSHSTFEDSSKARDMQGKYMIHLTDWYLIQLTGI